MRPCTASLWEVHSPTKKRSVFSLELSLCLHGFPMFAIGVFVTVRATPSASPSACLFDHLCDSVFSFARFSPKKKVKNPVCYMYIWQSHKGKADTNQSETYDYLYEQQQKDNLEVKLTWEIDENSKRRSGQVVVVAADSMSCRPGTGHPQPVHCTDRIHVQRSTRKARG